MKENIVENKGQEMNEPLSRLVDFIRKKGTLSGVARRLGFASNAFTNMVNRNSKPSFDVLDVLSREYSDFDVYYIFTGREVDRDASMLIKDKDRMIEQLEEKVNRYERILDMLPGKPEATIDSLLVDEESEAFGTFAEENFPEGIIPFLGMIQIAKYRDAEFIFPNCSHN